MRYLWLLPVLLLVCGCGGSSSSVSSANRFAGTWNGTWVNVNDPKDAGDSLWTVDSTGAVDGQDFDPGRTTIFHVVGSIDGSGMLSSNSTPAGGSPSTLDGPFSVTAGGQFTGILVWGVVPPLSYRYTFTRK